MPVVIIGHYSKSHILTENNTSHTFMLLYVNLTYCVKQCPEGKTCGGMFRSILSFLGSHFQIRLTWMLEQHKRCQMHGVILQVNAYAANNGIRYGMISNGVWSWVFRNDGCNNMSLSQAFRYDATTPTVLEVRCCHCPCIGLRSRMFSACCYTMWCATCEGGVSELCSFSQHACMGYQYINEMFFLCRVGSCFRYRHVPKAHTSFPLVCQPPASKR